MNGLGCNCDAGLPTQETDEGCLSNKKDLPVTQVRFGDTGDEADGKTAEFQILDVRCSGDGKRPLFKYFLRSVFDTFLQIQKRSGKVNSFFPHLKLWIS